MTGRRIDPPAIVELRKEFPLVMAGRGFEPFSPKSQWNGKYNVLEWKRESWKQDILRFGWRTGFLAGYFLTAQWNVPRRSDTALLAACLNPGYSRRRQIKNRFPPALPVIRRILLKRWCGEVLADITYALDWLDACSTLDGALAELSKPDHGGPAEGTKAYDTIVKFVKKHARKSRR
jgi:hypothetical protein